MWAAVRCQPVLPERGNISLELLVQSKEPALLYLQKAIYIEKMASHSHLVLLLEGEVCLDLTSGEWHLCLAVQVFDSRLTLPVF
eukprot:s4539_g11.t1